MIIPPPYIREIVEKTVTFVSKNGPVFEEKIREKERNNPRFSFLNGSDPFHNYYRQCLSEYQKSGRFLHQPTVGTVQQNDEIDPIPKTSVSDDMRKVLFPSDFNFYCGPIRISALDLDILKLTAYFAARNGRSFINRLHKREQRNPQFEFLSPTHTLHSAFLLLVDSYTKTMLMPQEIQKFVSECAASRNHITSAILCEVHERKSSLAKKNEEEDLKKREQEAYSLIDWHDFILVDTIDINPQHYQSDMEYFSYSGLSTMPLTRKNRLWNNDLSNIISIEDEMNIERPITTTTSETYEKCPICSKLFPRSIISDHIRIESIDPQWKKQVDAYRQKHIYSGHDVQNDAASHLSSFFKAKRGS